MPTKKVRDIIKEVEAKGWCYDHTSGDHHVYKHPTLKGNVVIPGKPGDDLDPGTMSSIRRQARGE